MLSDHKRLTLQSPVTGEPSNALFTFSGCVQPCVGRHYSLDPYQVIINHLVVLPLSSWRLEGGLLQGGDGGSPNHHPADNGDGGGDRRGGDGEEEEVVGDGGGGGEQGVLVPRGEYFSEKIKFLHNNIHLYWYQGKDKDAILLEWEGKVTTAKMSEDASTITVGNATELIKINKEEANQLNLKDSVLAPPSPYTVGQPPGKFVFLSGPPGAGKSSIAAWMAANANYVYYDGDGFLAGVNPYTPAEADEPTLATQDQHPLVGPGMHDREKAVEGFGQQFNAVIGDFSQVNVEEIQKFFFSLCDDIKAERKRLGGDMVVAFAIPDIASRDILRALLGPELVFVVLELSPELQAFKIVKEFC